MAHTLNPSPGESAGGHSPLRTTTPGLSLLAGGALSAFVMLVHLGVMKTVGEGLAQMDEDSAIPQRVQVRYVREMAVAAPVKVAPRTHSSAKAQPSQPTAAPRPRRLPEVAAVSETTPETASETAPEAVAQAASAPQAQALAPPEPAASVVASNADASIESAKTQPLAPLTELTAASATAPTTEPVIDSVWPQTTRLSYVVQGYYNGEWHGGATVEWVRQGDRYQMNMDVSLGLGILKRMATSQGRITEQGTRPERFDETTQSLFSKPRKVAVLLGEQQIEFSQGNKSNRPVGVQDTTSQFVQLTYMFSTRPELAQAGQRIEFPLALPRNLRAYAYQVQGRAVLQTALGALDTIHVAPRPVESKDNELIAQMWFAPQLKYLPARIRFSQGEETYIELNISKAPELAR